MVNMSIDPRLSRHLVCQTGILSAIAQSDAHRTGEEDGVIAVRFKFLNNSLNLSKSSNVDIASWNYRRRA